MAKAVLKFNQQHKPSDNEEVITNSYWKIIVQSLALIVVYFSLSIGLTFYQRWLLKDFHFPLFVVLTHLMVKLLLAWLCRVIYSWRSTQKRVVLSWTNYVTKVGPTGMASGLDVGFSNWGLALVTVSLYTMTKSTSIVFILGFALFFKLEKKSWSLVMIVLMIALGLFLFTYESTQFDVGGFFLILTASFMSGLRWTLAQLLMQKSKMGLENPIDMVYHVQPWMIIAILPFAVAFEGPRVFTNCKTYCFENLGHTSMMALTVFAGALLAFAMELSEYLVVTWTSSLTLSVACIFKEVFTLVLAVEWTGDKISVMNFIGLLVCLGGIIVHVVKKLTKTNKDGTETSFEMRTPLIADGSVFSTHSSGEESDGDSSNVLFSILQRRDATR